MEVLINLVPTTLLLGLSGLAAFFGRSGTANTMTWMALLYEC